MAKTTKELIAYFEELNNTNGYVSEADCIRAFAGLAVPVVDYMSNWLLQSKLNLRKGVGQQYKQELLERIKNPNVRDVKDTKDHTNVNRDKKQESKKDVADDKSAASHEVNKIIEESKCSEMKDEQFLPPWKRKGGKDYRGPENLEEWRAWFLQTIDSYRSGYAEDWKQYISSLPTEPEIIQAWELFQTNPNQPPPPPEGTVPAPTDWKKEPEQEFALDTGDGETLELAESQRDPVDQHLAMIAKSEYVSTIKKKVKFDNDTVFTVDIADTPAQKAAGLEVFDALSERAGLLFPFPNPDHVTFHMGAVKFPIDILFFNKDDLGFRVAKVIHNASPGDLDLWSCPDTICVLEIPGGSCERFGIGIDSYCKISARIEVA